LRRSAFADFASTRGCGMIIQFVTLWHRLHTPETELADAGDAAEEYFV
jgi:hypothetical protein